MSNIGSYTTRAFSENQKFLVLDPSTGTTSLVLGSSLVNYIAPQLNYVRAETTRVAAENTDYEIGTIIQTSGAETVGVNGAVYLVVAAGEGDFPMLNGNELLVIAGDDSLREDLASEGPNQGASLVSMEGGPSVEEAVNQRVIWVFSRTEMKAYDVPPGTQFSLDEGGRFGLYAVKSGTPPSDPEEARVIVLNNGNYAEKIGVEPFYLGLWGVAGDGIKDDSDDLEAAFQSGFKLKGKKGDVYRITRMIETDVLRCDFQGAVIDGTEIQSPVQFGVKVEGEAPSIHDISSALFKGDRVIPLSSVPAGIAKGDWVAVYDSADFSWSGFREAYRAGEFAYVSDVGASSITISDGLYDDYALTATLKLAWFENPGVFEASNLTANFERDEANAIISGIHVYTCLRPKGSQIVCDGSIIPVLISRCFDGVFDGPSFARSYVSSGASEASYAYKVTTSQDINTYNWTGICDDNHSFDVGGGDTVAGIVNRNVVFHDCIGSGESQWSFSLHGNSEYCGLNGGKATGLILGGDSMFARGVTIICSNEDEHPIRFTELLGTNIDVSDCNIQWIANPASAKQPAINLGFSGMLNSNTVRGGQISFQDNKFRITSDRADDNVNTGLIGIDLVNNGSPATDIDVLFAGNNFRVDGSGVMIPIVVRANSGADFRSFVEYGNRWPEDVYRSTLTNIESFNEGLGLISHAFVLPEPTIVFNNNTSVTSGASEVIYQRTGKTEVLSGTIFAEDFGITIEVDGRIVLDARAGGSIGKQRGKDSSGNGFGVVSLPHIMAYLSLEITFHEQASTTQSVGSSIYVKEY